MSQMRQVLTGILVALISVLIVLGGFSLALQEGNLALSRQDRAATPQQSPSPQLPETGDLASPQPTQTPPGIESAPILIEATEVCIPPPGWVIIKVQRSDTLFSIAQTYGTTKQNIIDANCLIVEDTLAPGSNLYVPAQTPSPTVSPTKTGVVCGPPEDWILYIVEPLDTIFYLSRAYGITEEELQFANCLGDSILIIVGQQIYVPDRATLTPLPTQIPSQTQTPRPTRTPTPTTPPIVKPTATSTSAFPSPTPTPPPTSTPLPTGTPIPPPLTATPTSTMLPPSPTPSPTATDTPSPTMPPPSATPTITPTPTNTPPPS